MPRLAMPDVTQASEGLRPAMTAFAIGEGFTGSASDWVEYAVWLVGLLGVLAYLAKSVRIRAPDADEIREEKEK